MSVNFVLHCSGNTDQFYYQIHLVTQHVKTNLCCRLSSVAEDTIRAYFESRLVLLEPVFPLACHRLCEGPDFSMDFTFKSQPQPEGKPKCLHIFTLPDMQIHHLTWDVVVCFSVARQIHEFFVFTMSGHAWRGCYSFSSFVLLIRFLQTCDAALNFTRCYRLDKRRITLQTSDTEYWWKGRTLLTLEFLIDSY